MDTGKLCECGCGNYVHAANRFIVGHNLLGVGKTLAERFWEKVNKNGTLPSAETVRAHPEIEGTQCWEWTGSKNRYGHLWAEVLGGTQAAHRVAWFLETGQWPEFFACHKCDNGVCVRFSHLFDGTQKQNVDDMKRKGRARPGRRHPKICKRGHNLENSYVHNGSRSCRECRNGRDKRRRQGETTTGW